MSNTSGSQKSEVTSMATTSSAYLPNIKCDVVQVLVQGGTLISVHENVLLQSPFFRNALKPEWVAMRDGKPIDLSDVDSDLFATYVQWLYTHQVAVSVRDPTWAELYVLGERLLDLEYQDIIILGIIANSKAIYEYPDELAISTIYEGTRNSSPARKLMVDFYCWRGAADWIDIENSGDLPEQFLRELVSRLMEKRDRPEERRPWNLDESAYCVGMRRSAQSTTLAMAEKASARNVSLPVPQEQDKIGRG
ncbi:hypothetical protein FB567DRAFT_600559 [Paraphoma chrysanthemicola]|uniref:BTB domain-containing protein n=1 Tax=Paraphoma chrysanthemicola TaxID=798071 RepID=A0A8K0RJF3_9PLEO|nr:hypothetical protein FB567DRAFT_600559 [Paraphoma chrysanthemicola]